MDRVSVIIVQDSNNNLFVHKRNLTKKVFPGLYGLGAGGKVEPNETPVVAAKRELREELGLDSPVEFLFDFPFANSSISYEVHVFLTRHNGSIQPISNEFDWAGWLPIQKVNELEKRNQLCPDTRIFFDRFKRINGL